MSTVIRRRSHVVMFSGGAGSWAAARRVVAEYGRKRTTLLFADTLIEDPDLYRFIHEAAQDVGVPLTRIADGRTIWEVFKDKRFLGNSRIDPCSEILKRNLMRKWIETNFDPRTTSVHLGIDWTESHRMDNVSVRWEPWRVRAPMCEAPFVDKEHVLTALRVAGIEPPRLYALGFAHNNCGGGCVKAGIGHFKLLLDKLPEVYEEWERNEQEMREYLGKDVAILRDRSGGGVRPLPLLELRQRVEGKTIEVDETDIGGCGCAVD